MSGVMGLGRRSGFLHRTLAEHAENWLDDNFAMRHRIGSVGVTIAEQSNHLAASAVFGAVYGAARPYLDVPPLVAGALFGAGLYATNIVGVAPLIGLTRGEDREPYGVVVQRFGMHVFFGVVTAVATEALITRWPPRQ
jgi:hypothetical protein